MTALPDPPDERDGAPCPHCERTLVDQRTLDLHRGFDHPEALTDAEREAFERAYEAESEELRRFQLLSLGLLVLLYFGFLFLYAVFA